MKPHLRIGFYGLIAGMTNAILAYVIQATFVTGVAVGEEVAHFLWNLEYLQEIGSGIFLGYLTEGMKYTLPLSIIGGIFLAYRTALSSISIRRIRQESLLIGILVTLPSVFFGSSLLIWSVYSMPTFILAVAFLALLSLGLVSFSFLSSVKWFAKRFELAP